MAKTRCFKAPLIVVAALALSGCKTTPAPEPDFSVTKSVKPYECTSSPGAKPRLSARDYSVEDSARAYRTLDRYTDKTLGYLDRCQHWTKAQP